jgi:O-antigen/teichoic acid export membrane protein
MALVWVAVPIIGIEVPRILSVELSRDLSQAKAYLGNGLAVHVAVFTALTLLMWLAGTLFLTVPLYYYFVLSIALLLSVSQSVCSVFLAYEKMKFDTVASLTVVVCLILFSGTVIHFDLGLANVFTAAVLAYLAGFAVSLASARKVAGFWPTPSVARPILRRLLAGSLVLFSIQILNQLLVSCGVFILKYLSGNVDVALFQAPMRIFTRFLVVPITLTAALLPAFTKMAALPEKRDELAGMARNVLKVLMIASMLLSIVAFATASELISLVYGKAFADSIVGFKAVVLGTMFYFINQFYVMLCMVQSRMNGFARIKVAELAICLALNLALIPRYGHVGSIWAVTLSGGATSVYGLLFFRDLLPRRSVLDILLVSAAGFGVIAVMQLLPQAHFVLSSTVGVGCYAAILFATGLITRADLLMLPGLLGAKAALQNKEQGA